MKLIVEIVMMMGMLGTECDVFRLIPGPLVWDFFSSPFSAASPKIAPHARSFTITLDHIAPGLVAQTQGICWWKWLLLYWLWEGTPWIFMFMINHSSQMTGFKTTRFDLSYWSYRSWVLRSLPEHGPFMTSDFSPCSWFQQHRLQTLSISRDVAVT